MSWDACQCSSVIDSYTVCAETTPGSADIGACTEVGTARSIDYPGALASLTTGQTVLARVSCITVDGATGASTSAPLVVDNTLPTVTGLTIQRATPVAVSATLPVPISPFVNNDTTARIQFTVTPSLSCIASVAYTISESSDPTNSSAYVMNWVSAGSGTPLSPSTAVVPSSSSSDPPSPGWFYASSFDVEVRGVVFDSGVVYYAVVDVKSCAVLETLVGSDRPMLVDLTPPMFNPLDVAASTRPIPYVFADNDYMFASWGKSTTRRCFGARHPVHPCIRCDVTVHLHCMPRCTC